MNYWNNSYLSNGYLTNSHFSNPFWANHCGQMGLTYSSINGNTPAGQNSPPPDDTAGTMASGNASDSDLNVYA